jgi:4-hydroxy-tetrahydrodipicolinate reductase
MKILASIIGFEGKMGKELRQNAPNFDIEIIGGVGKKDFNNLKDLLKKSKIALDFSSPQSLNDLLYHAKKNLIPLIIGTTGYTEEDFEKIKEASNLIPICYSSNFSIGIALLKSFSIQASKVLKDSFVDIIEKHHILKKDKPSGTALSLEKDLQNNLEKKINIHSIRASNIVGEHSIFFTNEKELIEIKHVAKTRAVFAEGALRAAKIIINKKPNFYSIQDLLGDFYASN